MTKTSILLSMAIFFSLVINFPSEANHRRYKKGYADGFSAGYDKGYQDGVDSCTPDPVPDPVPDPDPSNRWEAKPGLRWQWQLTGDIDTSVNADVFDIDGFDAPQSTINILKSNGKKLICYFSAGSWEDWRPDAGKFPDSVKGRGNGWPGERWLDIRRLDVLMPIMESRMDMCKNKGFDAVETDNIDGYSNNTGFSLSSQDQLIYNKALANAAHMRGLSIGLKNDVEQARQLEPYFDFAINEQCLQYNECDLLSVFIDNNKAVFHAEYSNNCGNTPDGFSTILKKENLGDSVVFCDR